MRQRVCQRLAFLLGEWFLNRRIGMPYVTEIFTSLRGNTEIVANIIAANVAEVQGVEGVTILRHNLNVMREFSIRLRVATEEGEFDLTATRNL